LGKGHGRKREECVVEKYLKGRDGNVEERKWRGYDMKTKRRTREQVNT
jgi:hypothetical protein